MVNSDDKNLCFKFWNSTMKLLHLLGFTKGLVFVCQLLLLDLVFFLMFLDGSHFFKEPVGIVCHAFAAFSI